MNRNFCYLCGAKLETVVGESTYWKCPGCGQSFFNNPRPTSSALILNDAGQILVATRGVEPWKGKLDLPGGFVEVGETQEQAMLRELYEELGVAEADVASYEYFTNGVDEYPWNNETLPTLVTAYIVRLKPGVTVNPQDDVAGLVFMDLSTLDMSQFAWKSEKGFIEKLIRKP